MAVGLGSCSCGSCNSGVDTSCLITQGPRSERDVLVLNDLLCVLRAKLKDNFTDSDGNKCRAFELGELLCFLEASLSRFNAMPTFTSFTWETLDLCKFRDIITEGAFILGIRAQSMIEAGREFNINDDGTSFTPPPVSSTMTTVWSTTFTQYSQDLQYIKGNMKPSPHTIGSFSSAVNNSPQLLRLRHLRQRRII